MQNMGFRINTKEIRRDWEIIEKFRELPVANIDDCMNRIAAVDQSIKPFNKAKLLGPAFTVKCPEGDNLMFHKALDMAKPGDILVIAGRGSMDRSLCGEIMVRYAMMKKLGGFLIDGCIRDAEAMADIDFPVYAKGVTPNGPYKNGPGEINVPVPFAGQIINPGDIIVGDPDGVIIINPEEALALIEKTKKLVENELRTFEAISSGKGLDRSWIDKALTEKNCEYI